MTNEEAATLIQSWLDGDPLPNEECLEHAVKVLRSPAPGAAAMREAAANYALDRARDHYEAGRVFVAHNVKQLSEEIRALPAPEVPDQMAAFGAAAWGLLKTRYGAAEMCEGDEAFIELALKAGLCTRQPYDREQHGYVEDADEGDMIYVWGNR